MPRLENWSLTQTLDPYQAPELAVVRLRGYIYEDNRFLDGSPIITSRVLTVSLINKVAQTRNTKYELGEIDPDFLKWMNENGHKLSDYEVSND